MNKLTITAAALAASIIVQTQSFAQIATTTSAGRAAAADLELAAHQNWRALMAKNDVPAEGCFHASYPSFVWESVDCKLAQPRANPVRTKPSATAAPVAQVVGNGTDFVAKGHGLITQALGSFKVTGLNQKRVWALLNITISVFSVRTNTRCRSIRTATSPPIHVWATVDVPLGSNSFMRRITP
jgi:hypothetical protein